MNICMYICICLCVYIYICMIDHSEYHCFFQSQTCAKQEWQDHMSQLLSSAFPPSSTSPASWFRSRIGRFNGKTRGKPMWIIGKNPPKIGNIWNMDMKHGFKIRKNIGKPMWIISVNDNMKNMDMTWYIMIWPECTKKYGSTSWDIMCEPKSGGRWW